VTFQHGDDFMASLADFCRENEVRQDYVPMFIAGSAGTKGSTNPATGDELLAKIDEISKIFWETKQA
jgi:hypothetical protein